MSYLTWKKTSIFFLAIFLIACSKDKDPGNELPNSSAAKGSLYGTVKLFNLYAEEIHEFGDVKIEFIDSLDQAVVLYPDSSGVFRVDDLPTGQLVLTIDKAGYNGLQSIYIVNTSNRDTIPEIMLFEEIPFAFKEFSAEYVEQFGYQRVYWEVLMDYETAENYVVGQILLFSPVEDVSSNNYAFSLHGGDYFVNNSGFKEGYRGYSRSGFIEHGFEKGQTVYATSYAINKRFKHYFWMVEHNFDIITLKLDNPSNTSSFIFDW